MKRYRKRTKLPKPPVPPKPEPTTALALNEPLISEEDMCWLTVIEAWGYNPRCQWCNDATGYVSWSTAGILFLHPYDAKRLGAQIWGNFGRVKLCLFCQNRFNKLREKREAEYNRLHPNGVEPIFTANPNDPDEARVMVQYLHARVIEQVVKDGGMKLMDELLREGQRKIDEIRKRKASALPQG